MTITSLNIQDGTFKDRRCHQLLRKRYVVSAVTVIIVCAFAVIYFLTKVSTTEPFEKPSLANRPNPETPLLPSASALRKFEKGAVCSDAAVCSNIGSDILSRNGSAVDATIATMFCNGLVTMQSMGIGGGFFMTVYTRKDQTAITLNAREVAPLKATPSMFSDDPIKSRTGPLAVAVPGELRGYKAAHDKFGILKWKELVQPTIELCKLGYNMSQHQQDSLSQSAARNDTLLKDVFMQRDGSFRSVGSLIKYEKYCKTLELIAENPDDLYTGTLATIFVQDIQEMGGIITKEDLQKYETKWEDAVKIPLKTDTLYSMPAPGSGHILGLILNILQGYNFTSDSINGTDNTVLTYHRIIESFKYAYAQRTFLGDPAFNNLTDLFQNLTSTEFADMIRSEIIDNMTYNDPEQYGAVSRSKEDHGTSHISVIAPNGDAVSVTSSINLYFGAGITSKSTGIILNSGMDDFSSTGFKNFFGLPFSEVNVIAPRKRSLSSMSPSIITNKNGDVRMVIGAAGGTKIPTGVALVIMRNLWFGQNIKEAIDAPRFHHQIFPMQVSYEYGMVQPVFDGLTALGHNMTRYLDRGSVVCALTRKGETIYANADYRKGGDVFGLD